MPGDLFMERRIRSLIRWNALAMVVRANRRPGDLGGHISVLLLLRHSMMLDSVHFFVRRSPPMLLVATDVQGDLVYFQKVAASPGIYARSFWRGV